MTESKNNIAFGSIVEELAITEEEVQCGRDIVTTDQMYNKLG